MIEILQLEERDRKRKVTWQVSPHVEKHCILLSWTKAKLLLAVPTGKKNNPHNMELVDPREVSFKEEA
ncbi:MAG TPA: hypothetical protein VGC91_07950 [Pyrinomonadaceae bacterium]|jgi:hypothetical protein